MSVNFASTMKSVVIIILLCHLSSINGAPKVEKDDDRSTEENNTLVYDLLRSIAEAKSNADVLKANHVPTQSSGMSSGTSVLPKNKLIIPELEINEKRKNDKYRLVGEDAERAFISKHYGFINPEFDQQSIKQLLNYVESFKNGYEIETFSYSKKLFDDLRSTNKKLLCKHFINDNITFRQKDIEFHESADKKGINLLHGTVAFTLSTLRGRKYSMISCPCINKITFAPYTYYILPLIYIQPNLNQYAFVFTANTTNENKDELHVNIYSLSKILPYREDKPKEKLKFRHLSIREHKQEPRKTDQRIKKNDNKGTTSYDADDEEHNSFNDDGEKSDEESGLINIPASEVYINGKSGIEAELALLNLDFGYVNYDKQQTPEFKIIFRDYLDAKNGHEIQPVSFKKKELVTLKNSKKTELCKRYLSDPLLEDNYISYDKSAAISKIQYTSKNVIYAFHDKQAETHQVVQCPIKIGTKEAYLYMSHIERTEAEKEGRYFIFAEHSESSDKVSVLMRSKIF